MDINRNESKWITRLLIIACVVCNISQIPVFWENRLIGITYTIIWIALFAMTFLKNADIDLIFNICRFALIFDIFCFMMYLINGGGYVTSDLFRPVNLSAFVMIVGTFTGKYIDDDAINRLSKFFIASVIVFAIYVYINYFRGVDWAGSGVYVYTAKNSAGQILLNAIIILLIYYVRDHKVISWGLILFLGALIFMMKSRAVIMSSMVVVVYYLFFYVKNTVVKLLGVAACAAVFWITLTDEHTYNLLINQILLNNRNADDITAVSSYRDKHLELFLEQFPDNMIIGTGGTYLESMPLAVLLSYGLIGGIPLLLFSLYPIYLGVKRIRQDKAQKELCHFIILLGLTMTANGIFEEQAPFGPGVKCFFLWLMTGFLIGRIREEKVSSEAHRQPEGFVYSSRL